VRDLQLIVTCKLPLAAPVPAEPELLAASELRQATEQALATAGLAPEPLDADRYVRLLTVLLNWAPMPAGAI